MSETPDLVSARRPVVRTRRFIAFAEKQESKRQWVRLSRLALHYARAHSPDGLSTLSHLWILQGYGALVADIKSGFFNSAPQLKFPEREKRLHLLYLHPSIPPDRMTVDWLDLLCGVIGQENRADFVANTVACCWTSMILAAAWCESRDLPPLAEKRGPKMKDDSLTLAAAARYREEGYTLREAARLAINDSPELSGASPDAIFDRIRRKLAALEK
jgi:hypothetical protein